MLDEATGAPEVDDAVATEARHPISCRTCSAEVSDRAALFTVDSDRVQRVFSNPAGYLHDVVTVRRAHNLTAASPPTTEFTWFAGYAWEVALCATCGNHLGWSFSATTDQQPARFYGLRRPAITGA